MISSKQFFDLWVEKYEKNKKPLSLNWDDRKKYTIEIKKVCDDLAKELNLDTWHEYYSSDTIFYKKDNAEIIGGSTYIINPEIVFEHENEANNFLSEIAHNLIIKSKLYVTVSYYKSTPDINYLNKIKDLINKSSSSNEFKKNKNFLLIIGDDREYQSKNYWKGYIFHKKKWLLVDSH